MENVASVYQKKKHHIPHGSNFFASSDCHHNRKHIQTIKSIVWISTVIVEGEEHTDGEGERGVPVRYTIWAVADFKGNPSWRIRRIYIAIIT